MAIKNASDLLVYAKTACTLLNKRLGVRVLTSNHHYLMPENGTTGTVKINNIT